MKTSRYLLLLLIGLAQPCFSESLQWELPIVLGATREAVHDRLGPPQEILSAASVREKYPELEGEIGGVNNEYFYSSGLVTRVHNNKVFGITINAHAAPRGWVVYQGKIVNGVTLSDTYDSIVKKLGKPTKVEEEIIEESKSNLNQPVVFPAERRCYWRADTYTVQINFLRQAQSVAEGNSVPRGAISSVLVYR